MIKFFRKFIILSLSLTSVSRATKIPPIMTKLLFVPEEKLSPKKKKCGELQVFTIKSDGDRKEQFKNLKAQLAVCAGKKTNGQTK